MITYEKSPLLIQSNSILLFFPQQAFRDFFLDVCVYVCACPCVCSHVSQLVQCLHSVHKCWGWSVVPNKTARNGAYLEPQHFSSTFSSAEVILDHMVGLRPSWDIWVLFAENLHTLFFCLCSENLFHPHYQSSSVLVSFLLDERWLFSKWLEGVSVSSRISCWESALSLSVTFL